MGKAGKTGRKDGKDGKDGKVGMVGQMKCRTLGRHPEPNARAAPSNQGEGDRSMRRQFGMTIYFTLPSFPSFPP